MITKDEFMAYEEVRISGVTNMFNVTLVSTLAELSREKCLEIMKSYSALKKNFLKSKDEVVIG